MLVFWLDRTSGLIWNAERTVACTAYIIRFRTCLGRTKTVYLYFSVLKTHKNVILEIFSTRLQYFIFTQVCGLCPKVKLNKRKSCVSIQHVWVLVNIILIFISILCTKLKCTDHGFPYILFVFLFFDQHQFCVFAMVV